MQFKTVKLRPDSPAVLEIYLRENQENLAGARRPCVIICPGGAYVFCGDRDSEPNALALLGEGFQACVLRTRSVCSVFRPADTPQPAPRYSGTTRRIFPAARTDLAVRTVWCCAIP